MNLRIFLHVGCAMCLMIFSAYEIEHGEMLLLWCQWLGMRKV